MKKQLKKLVGILLAFTLIFSLQGIEVNAATARHYCIKYTTKSTWYGITADIYLPSSINVVSNNNDYVDWYIGMDPTSGNNVEAGISYKNGQFRVFLNTGDKATSSSSIDSSIRPGQKVNLKIRLSSDGKKATLYVNGVSRKTANTTGVFTNGKGKGKIVMGVQDGGTSTHSKAYFANVKLCANSAGTSYTNMTSSMGNSGKYAPTGSSNPYSIYSTFPISASLKKN